MDEVINMKRLLIYLTYDRQNIIDDYIGYFLRSMRPIADSIVVVCNMSRIEKGFYNLLLYADSIHYRENKGLDCGGFKDALCDFIGWEQIKEYDEVILANDSFYGPFDSINKIFSEMESRSVDFWGLMKRGPGKYGSTGSDPEHILSFFYVFQAPLIHSAEFQSYWEDMPYYKDYMTVVKEYERQLTRHFASYGYVYDTYADTAPNETSNLKNQFFQCDYLSFEMIAKRNFPFLKRKQLSYNTLYFQTQENPILSIEYIDKFTDYDTALIWKNLIRTQHPTNLQRSLGLQYILEDSEKKRHDNVIICVRVDWLNGADTVSEYLERIKDVCDVRIITDNEELRECYHKKGFEVVLSKEEDIRIICSIDTANYEYICLIHDTDLSSDQIPSCTGKSYFFNIWENLIKNAGYIDSVTNLFGSKPYIGMLMHPVPIFSTWISRLNFEWGQHFDDVKRGLTDLGMHAVIDASIPPVQVTDNFWLRSEVINVLKERFQTTSCEYILSLDIWDYLWTCIVQDSGYLTGIVESTFYAAMNEANYHYYLRTLMDWLEKRYGYHRNLYEFEEILRVQEAVQLCAGRHKEWYVYGTGEIAERCFEWIQNACGFIISDGQIKSESFHGRPVMYLSELQRKDEFGVVLCLSRENQDFVVELLKEKGINHYYVIN